MPSAEFRLPHDVRPSHYAAELHLDLAQSRFKGELVVTLAVQNATREFWLHSVDLDVTELSLASAAGPCRIRSTARDAGSQTVAVVLADELPPGQAVLKVRWSGRFNPGLRGLYWADEVAVTQFEAADARRVFPCFDEPGFKARWRLVVHGVPAGATAISNGNVERIRVDPEGHQTIEFAATRPIATYLVALVVGRLTASPPDTVCGVEVRTWAVPAKAHLLGFAQEVARAALPRLEDYFGVPYAFGKLDQIGIPNFEAGAMENVGAITFRETALLVDEVHSPLHMRKVVAEIISHELAHQWFGNLVTMTWWDDLWLNEAFATWMGYKVVDQWRPEWRIWLDFAAGKETALAFDALRNTHPVRTEVLTPEQAGESFDAITYEKGAAVLRMLEGYLGESVFQRGIRSYIRHHLDGNTVASDLWSALDEASGEPVEALMRGWLEAAGFPLISLALEEESGEHPQIRVTQTRYFADPAAQATRGTWMVPLVFKVRDDGGIHEHRVLLRDKELVVDVPVQGSLHWCLGNQDDRGFFRTRYDAPLHAHLVSALLELAPVERRGLLADAWAFVRSAHGTIESFLSLAQALRGEEDHSVLDELVGCLSALEHGYVGVADRDRLRLLVTDLLGPAWASLGWYPQADEDDGRRLARAAVVRGMVLVGRDPTEIRQAEGLFQRVLTGTNLPGTPDLDPNLVDAIVAAGARAANAETFDRLVERARTEVEPAARRRFLHATARVEAPDLVARAVERGFSEQVSMQDFPSYMAILLANPVARTAAWAAIRDEWPRVDAKLGAPMLRQRLVEALAVLPGADALAEVQGFLTTRELEGCKQAAAQTLERMQLNLAMRKRIEPYLHAWLSARD